MGNPSTPGPYSGFPFPAAPLPKKIRKVGAPLGVIIALGTLTGLVVILLTATNPLGTSIGFLLASVAMTVVVLAYLWLDRWEPEPPRLLILAFLWGASVAVIVSIVLELYFGHVLATGAEATDNFVSTGIGAPLIEEALKGLFLILMMTGRRRNELNSLTDCLVYAGLTAAGFAWLENIAYIADGGSLGESLVVAAMRLVMGPFAHPLFTTMTGIGVYFALHRRSGPAKAGCIVAGYAGAVIMHALWNGSALFGVETYFLVYVFWMVPVFGGAILLGIASRRREQRIVATKLPGMVSAGIITPNEASWLGSIRTRKLAFGEVTRYAGKPAAITVRKFAAAVVELAFVRDRIDRGFGDQRVYALQAEEVQEVASARYQAPALQWLANYRLPDSPPPRPR